MLRRKNKEVRAPFKESNPHNIQQPETIKGMGQDTHTQTNRGRRKRNEAD